MEPIAGAIDPRNSQNVTPAGKAAAKPQIVARIEPNGATIKAIGREAWALKQLVRAGTRGCTPIDHPGPRWSHYVWKLRALGLVIETVHEAHSGPFAGTHARYCMHSQVTIIEERGMAA